MMRFISNNINSFLSSKIMARKQEKNSSKPNTRAQQNFDRIKNYTKIQVNQTNQPKLVAS